jgi:hypothetical protein
MEDDMVIDEIKKHKYIKYFKEVEGEDFVQVIRVQIQKVVKETARLIGLLEGGYQLAGIDSSEYKKIREFSPDFLDKLMHTAKELNVQIQ